MIVSNAGNYTVRATIEERNYYNSGTATANFTISPKSVTIPTLSNTSKTYTGSAQSPTVTGYNSNTMTQGGTSSATNAGDYTVTWALKDAANYQWSDGTTGVKSGTWSIAKAGNPLTFTATQSVSTTFSTSEQTVTLTPAENGQGAVSYFISSQKQGTSEVSYFTVNDTTLTLKESTSAGTYTVVVSATAAGNDNYNSGTKDSTVTVTVGKADISPVVSIDGWTYGDAAKEPATSDNPGNGGVTYNYKNRVGTADYDSSFVPTNAGDYTVTAAVEETANYNSGTATKDFTIARQDITLTFVEGGSGNNVRFYPDPVPNGIDPVVTLLDAQGKTIPDSEYDVSTSRKAHKVTISDYIENGGNYNITTATFSYPYEVGTAEVRTVPAAAVLTYNGGAQELLKSAGASKNGTMQYALGTDSENAPTDGWTAEYTNIKARDAGDH